MTFPACYWRNWWMRIFGVALISLSLYLIIHINMLGKFWPRMVLSVTRNEQIPVRVMVQPSSIVIDGLAEMKYERCVNIPKPPFGGKWPEEEFINDPKTIDIRDLAEPANSRVAIEGPSEVRVGDTVYIRVELHDGHGRRKTTGGDLVRVWMKEPRFDASATASVIDNEDGSYSSTVPAFWEGSPRIVAAIISPREVIAIQFRRRYICPPVVVNTAKFERYENRVNATGRKLIEETPCNVDPQVPGYPIICNLTDTHHGPPWYCGKPRSNRLNCKDWTEVSKSKLWQQEKKIIPDVERELLSPKYKARKIPTNITVTVYKEYRFLSNIDGTNEARFRMNTLCNNISKELTWYSLRPSGYLYNRKWTSRYCSGKISNTSLSECLKNTKVILIGDSTLRQMFFGMKRRISCSGDTNKSYFTKHCDNETLNLHFILKPHTLPFGGHENTSSSEVKPLSTYLNNIIDSRLRTILILHVYAHVMQYHSYVFYEALYNMKQNITYLLKHVPNIFIIIKGPHAFSFTQYEDNVLWKPDKYTDVYQAMIQDTFGDLSDKVMYLDCQDITVSSEQLDTHAEDYVIDALVDNVFNHICPK